MEAPVRLDDICPTWRSATETQTSPSGQCKAAGLGVFIFYCKLIMPLGFLRLFLSEPPFRGAFRARTLLRSCSLLWDGRGSPSGRRSSPALSPSSSHDCPTRLFKSWKLHDAAVVLTWTMPLVSVSYRFDILFYTLSGQLLIMFFFYSKRAACLPVKPPDNPENRNTAAAQCYTMNARHRGDLWGHPHCPLVKSQDNPQGNDAPNVPQFPAW